MYKPLLTCCKRIIVSWSGPCSCTHWMMFQAHADCALLCFIYRIYSRYLCLRSLPVCPAYEDRHLEHYTLYTPLHLHTTLTDECSGRKQKNSNLKTWAEYYPGMFVVTCDKGAVIYKTIISILAPVESSYLLHKPTAFGYNNFQSNTVIL